MSYPWSEHKATCDDCVEAWAWAIAFLISNPSFKLDRIDQRMIVKCCRLGGKLFFQEVNRAKETAKPKN